jgi:hypothetical protein
MVGRELTRPGRRDCCDECNDVFTIRVTITTGLRARRLPQLRVITDMVTTDMVIHPLK